MHALVLARGAARRGRTGDGGIFSVHKTLNNGNSPFTFQNLHKPFADTFSSFGSRMISQTIRCEG
jgi:hypothetical protein